MNVSELNTFPVYALPGSIKDVVIEIQRNIKAPLPLIASSAFGSLSLAIQGLIDIRLPHGQVRPVSLFTITIADSGERKTTCDQLLMKPIREFEEIANQKADAAMAQYEADMRIWELKCKALSKKILKLEGKDISNAY